MQTLPERQTANLFGTAQTHKSVIVNMTCGTTEELF